MLILLGKAHLVSVKFFSATSSHGRKEREKEPGMAPFLKGWVGSIYVQA